MERKEAYSKWLALRNMTADRGCFNGEVENAKALAQKLDDQWRFSTMSTARSVFDRSPRKSSFWDWWEKQREYARKPSTKEQHEWQAEYETWARAWKWEGRKCGKGACWCSRSQGMHGPYRYGKMRYGLKNRRVKSVYLGTRGRKHTTNKRAVARSKEGTRDRGAT